MTAVGSVVRGARPLVGVTPRGDLPPIRPVDPVRSPRPEEYPAAKEEGAVLGGRPLDERSAGAPPALDRRGPASLDLSIDERIQMSRDRAAEGGAPSLDEAAADSLARAAAKRGEARPDDPSKPSEREIRQKLDELYGEKAKEERSRAEGQAARGSETQAMLSKLKARDAEVRGHEAAHVAAGGRFVTGGASYSYQKGPDGRHYAVGGEVGIDSSPVPGKPAETAAKMRIVRASALAPAEPSGADLSVAAGAAQAEAQALAQLAAERREASKGGAAGREGASSAPPAAAPQPAEAYAATGRRDRAAQPGSLLDLVA